MLDIAAPLFYATPTMPLFSRHFCACYAPPLLEAPLPRCDGVPLRPEMHAYFRAHVTLRLREPQRYRRRYFTPSLRRCFDDAAGAPRRERRLRQAILMPATALFAAASLRAPVLRHGASLMAAMRFCALQDDADKPCFY